MINGLDVNYRYLQHITQAMDAINLTAELECCPNCGSGDIRWCNISVRPHCNECGYWGRVNFGSALDAKLDWNKASRRSNAALATNGRLALYTKERDEQEKYLDREEPEDEDASP